MHFWNWGNNIWNVRDFILSGVAISNKLLSIPNIYFYLRIYLLGEQTIIHTLILWHQLRTFLKSISETQRTWYFINIMKLVVESWKFSMWIQHSEFIYQCSFSWIKSQLSSFMYNTVEVRLTVVWKLILLIRDIRYNCCLVSKHYISRSRRRIYTQQL